MRSFIVLLVIGAALFASAEDKLSDVHKTTVRVTPGILSKLLGSKPTSISVDGNTKQKKPALLSHHAGLADYPEQNPNLNPYTLLPQKPFYQPSRPYPQPYPVPFPYPQPQPLSPQIPPYPQYPGYPQFYPGIQPYPQFPVYPNYPSSIYPSSYPSKYPYPYPSSYPGYPFFAEPSDESVSGSGASSSPNPDQIGETVTNPELSGESSNVNDVDNDQRQTKPASVPELMPSSVSMASPMPVSLPPSTPVSMPLPSSVPLPSSMPPPSFIPVANNVGL